MESRLEYRRFFLCEKVPVLLHKKDTEADRCRKSEPCNNHEHNCFWLKLYNNITVIIKGMFYIHPFEFALQR